MNPQDIPEMQINKKYSDKKPIAPKDTNESQKNMDKTKKDLEKLKNFIIKKFPFIQAIGMIPPQAIKRFIDEEEIPKETEKHIQLYTIVPEKKMKQIPEIKKVLIKEIEKSKQKIWIQVKTPIDIWEMCMDSKFDLAEAIAMSFPLYDKGFLGELRVAEVHKSLVLRKFEKYVVSYVVAGSLVRGETKKTSDVDVFIIINDTDVKRMPRLELKERLRSIIYQYVAEASAIAGVKNKLSPQIYLLTDFWESVKDAHPVMFTFIRDGVPLYDRGTFTPWKSLLRMGRLKPSPEAIEMFMSMGDRTIKMAKRRLLDIAIQDLFHGVLTPSQGILMLKGHSPATPRETVKDMEKIFVVKEKLLERKYLKTLDKIVEIFKGYEHGKVKELKGVEIDKLMKDTEDYIKRLKELRTQIEKRANEKTIEQLYNDTFKLLKGILGNKSQEKTIEAFNKKLVKTSKFSPQHLRILKNIVDARTKFKKGKSSSKKIDDARKNASILINDLIEFAQRKDIAEMNKARMIIKYNKDKIAEILTADDKTFLFIDKSIKKLTTKAVNSTMEEVTRAVENQKKKPEVKISTKIFEILKKELGDFEIII